MGHPKMGGQMAGHPTMGNRMAEPGAGSEKVGGARGLGGVGSFASLKG